MATPQAIRQAGRGRPLRPPRGAVNRLGWREPGRAPPPVGRGHTLAQKAKEMGEKGMGRGGGVRGGRSELAEFVLRGGSGSSRPVGQGNRKQKGADWFSSTERLQALERLGDVEERMVGVEETDVPFGWGNLQGGVEKLEEGHWAKGWLEEVVRGVEGNGFVGGAEKEKIVGECFKVLRDASLVEQQEKMKSVLNHVAVMQDKTGNTLVQLQVIHRHGARAPGEALTFPTICGHFAYRTFFNFDPKIPDVSIKPVVPNLFYPSQPTSCYAGQLTPIGAAQMFALGVRLRQRYSTFLPDMYQPDLVKVRSTAVKRTIESAVACLSGMYPGNANRNLNLEVKDREDDFMVPYKARCCKLHDFMEKIHKQFVMPSGLDTATTEVLGRKQDRFGANASRAMIALRDFVVAMHGNGFATPVWADMAEKEGTQQIVRLNEPMTWGLSVGKFVLELLDNVDKYATVGWICKIYSGHDTTLLPLMAIFEGSARRGVPNFAADVVLETWKQPKAKEPLMRVTYEGEGIVMKGCEAYGELCPASVVRKMVETVVPKDYWGACGGSLRERNRSRNLPEEHDYEPHSDGTTF